MHGYPEAAILPQEMLIVLKKEAEQTLDQLAAMYGGKIPLKFMPEGSPAQEILSTAKNWEADLIVVGSHGGSGLLHVLMGSISEHVIRHSKIPVMVVPSRAWK